MGGILQAVHGFAVLQLLVGRSTDRIRGRGHYVEVFVIASFLRSPISIWEAWILESAVQLTRAATFFIPLSLGAQEGALFMVAAVITGDGAFGITISLVKRLREIIWIAWGFAIGWRMPFTSK